MDMWYAVERLSPNQHGQLTRNGIPYAVTQVTQPVRAEVTTVPGEFRDRLIEMLEYGAATEQPTNLENTMLLTRGMQFSVTQHQHESDCDAVLRPTLQWFANRIRMNVETSNPHGYTMEPRTEVSKFFIWYWSVPAIRNRGRGYIRSAYGMSVADGQRDALDPSGSGILISDPEGVAVAELHGANLYILFDLPHSPRSNPDLLRRILEDTLMVMQSPEDYNRAARERLREVEAQSRGRYIEACSRRGASEIHNTREEVTRLQRDQNSYSENLVSIIRQLDAARRRLLRLEEDPGDNERYGVEFDKLKACAHVDSVVVGDENIVVMTDHLVTYPLSSGRQADLGVYRIILSIDGRTPTCYNLTRQIGGVGHPHCHGGGDMCWGNIGRDIVDLAARYEFSVVTQLIIEFLQTINEGDDYGRRVRNWPTYVPTAVAAAPTMPTPANVDDGLDDDYDYEDDDEYYDEEDDEL